MTLIYYVSVTQSKNGTKLVNSDLKQCHVNDLTWQYLTLEYHVNDLSIKLNRANALLFKMRKYVSLKILRSIYLAIFDSYLTLFLALFNEF